MPESENPQPGPPTQILLDRMRDGDAGAARELFAVLYAELKDIARRELGRIDRLGGAAAAQTLQPTALVNEAWLKLFHGAPQGTYRTRFHFCCTVAKAMRSVLVDHARERRADKRGGSRRALSLDDTGAIATSDLPLEHAIDVLPLHEAMEDLAAFDPELVELVELRFFAGLSNEEIAALRELSLATIERRFALARAWLHRRLQAADGERAG